MTKAKLLPALLFTLLIQACASGVVVVDTGDLDENLLEQDLAECRSYANKLDEGDTIIKSALFGGLFYGLMEWMFTGDQYSAHGMAVVGAVEGGAIAAVDLEHQKDEVAKNCMANRGYAVLN